MSHSRPKACVNKISATWMVLFFPDLNSTEKKTASPSIQSQLTKQTEKKKIPTNYWEVISGFFCLFSWELSWKSGRNHSIQKHNSLKRNREKKMQFTQLQIEVVLILGWLQNSWKTPAPAVNKAKISNLYSAQCANGMFERRDFTAWESFSKAERFFFASQISTKWWKSLEIRYSTRVLTIPTWGERGWERANCCCCCCCC